MVSEFTIAMTARILSLGSGPHCPKDYWQAIAMLAYFEGVNYEDMLLTPAHNTKQIYLFPAATCLECGNTVDFRDNWLPVDFTMGCGNCCRNNVILAENFIRRDYPGYLITAAKRCFTKEEYYRMYSEVSKIPLTFSHGMVW